ncbi:acetyltransferase [Dasania sp. GY-MA-18]|uniref:Acetyltransferase n=1 Tax=Dasania phycosphaerae TaxID=2950436 RepID=A0A9J6RK06_9GAMM|nr:MULTISPECIES: acetyltransferase [Dasania]MCR8922132.1 acetyltransferase [Dasania sp. GY-MA-18]MCZ0864560.1 acetyltransferase [Dasania phycosphaerae]MCZ0868288.1 acetyltransferase [Dasania phycosphaerae]
MSNKLAVIGAGGHGKVVAEVAILGGFWDEVVFFDDAYPKVSGGRWPVVGSSERLFEQLEAFDGVIVAIGNNQLRLNKTMQLLSAGGKVVSVVHPSAVVSPYAQIDLGTVVFPGAIINADAVIGLACIINTAAVIEHDCLLHEGVHISPHATLSGQTVVGARSWLGAASVTKELVTVGSDVIVGAGAVVVKSLPSGVTAVGNPARVLVNR